MQVIQLESAPAPAAATRPAAASSRPDRACDFCRRRKTRCDGPWSPERVCSICRAARIPCTYVQQSKPRGPPKAYIAALEDWVERTEDVIRNLRPDLFLQAEIGPSIPRGSWKSGPNPVPAPAPAPAASQPSARPSGSPELSVPGVRPILMASTVSHQAPAPAPARAPDAAADGDSDDDTGPAIAGGYMGKSSSQGLINATIAVKKEYDRDYDLVLAGPVDDRPSYEARALEELQPVRDYHFPPTDLCEQLVELYFHYTNSHFPLLHKPTFLAQFRTSLHTRDRAFASLFFAVLAVASRWSSDPRVLFKEGSPKVSSGWKFLRESMKYRPSALAPPSLFYIQRIALQATFLRWTKNTPASWGLVALGLRLAQEVGAHRKSRYQSRITVEDELWKRAFWVLVLFDRLTSATLGRPCCAREEDFDLDLLLEVDDEYWISDDPNLAFKQPPRKPSRIIYFNSFLKLTQMMAFTLRTIYCIDKTKILLGLVGPNWREQVVGQLNEAMEEWARSLPDFLRWGPELDPLFLSQSGTLYTTYYLLLCLIYRPFIPPPKVPRVNGKPPLNTEYPFPALAICVSAARAGIRILETQMSQELSNTPNMIAVAHLCAALVVMDMWELKKQNPKTDVSDHIKDAKLCLQALAYCKDTWESANFLYNSLKQGLPKEPSNTDQRGVQTKEAKPGPPPGPAKPPMPPGSPDYPHERAMQPLQLTEGWHWFSQVGIGPTYAQRASSSAVDERPPISQILQPASSEGSLGHQPVLHSRSYPVSDSRHGPLIPPAAEATAVQAFPNYMSYTTGQVPWWVESATVGRPAHHANAPHVPEPVHSSEYAGHAGGNAAQWDHLAHARPTIPQFTVPYPHGQHQTPRQY